MAVLSIEELMRSIELLLKIRNRKTKLLSDEIDLDPVLLVPGIAGSILNAVDENGNEERVWVRILNADHEFRTKLWSRFDPSTGKTESLDEKTKIVVPENRYGLYAIDVLDPDLVIGSGGVCYYHDLMEEMIKWGFKEGKTLFGFGYDFRQSNRLQETLDKFAAKLETAYTLSGGKKLNIVTHSMGGLLVKCFMCLHTAIFEKYVKSWIAIASPFRGAPGYITSSLLNGCSFVEGWEQNFFISKWSMHQLLIECPSIYELMGCPNFHWEDVPLLQMWKEKLGDDGNSTSLLESYGSIDAINIMKGALHSNSIGYDGQQIPLPLNMEILKWANETREIMSHARLPSSIKFYNIYGMNCDTPHSVCYGSEKNPVSNIKDLPLFQAKYIYVNGDGTVPAESAKADGLDAVARVGVHADHRGIVCDRHVFRILKHWLGAGEPDPFYNPVNDYVILPTAFEIERHSDNDMQITSVTEEWEIIPLTKNSAEDLSDDEQSSVCSISISSTGKEEILSESHASLISHPQQIGPEHVELRAVSITTSA